MAESSLRDLQYGHVGQPFYDIDSSTWRFGRKCGETFSLKLQRLAKVLVGPSSSKACRAQNGFPSQTIRRQTRRLLQAYPEFAPASEFISSYAQVCSVSKLADTDQDLQGSLLAFGKIPLPENRNTRAIKIVAIAGGENRERLQIHPVREDIRAWNEDCSVTLRVPTVKDNDASYWSGDGTPIQQISFTEPSVDDAASLAVRTLRSTSIFRLSCRLVSVSNGHQGTAPPMSPVPKIELDLVCSVPLYLTRGVSHSDVSINPWCSNQFAIVDRQGKWRVFEINTEQRTRPAAKVIPSVSGKLEPVSFEGDNERSISGAEDGWGRILWLGGGRILVASTRSTWSILNLEGVPQEFSLPDVGLQGGRNLILDIREIPNLDNCLLLLTSDRLLLLRINPPTLDHSESQAAFEEQPNVQSSSGQVIVLLSWTHFRDPHDVTLQMVVERDAEDVIHALLFSRLNHMISCFELLFPPPESAMPVSLSDPTAFFLPQRSLDNNGTKENIRSIILKSLCRVAEAEAPKTELDRAQSGSYINFYVIMALSNDNSLVEYLAYSGSYLACDVASQPLADETVTNLQNLDISRARLNDFDIDIGYSYGEYFESEPKRAFNQSLKPKTSQRARHDAFAGLEQGDDLSVAWTRTDEVIYHHMLGRSLEEEELVSTINRLRSELDAMSVDRGLQNRTLLELCSKKIAVVDIEKAATTLQQFTQMIDSGQGERQDVHKWKLRTSASNPAWRSDASTVHPLDLYDRMINHWLASLSSQVPGKLRLAKEKLIRSIAIEVCLASASLEFEEVPVDDGPVTAFQSPETFSQPTSFLTLPVRETREMEVAIMPVLGDNSQERPSEHPRPLHPSNQKSNPDIETALPTPEATPSMKSSGSFSSHTTEMVEVQHNLNRFGIFSRKAFLNAPLARSLSHWTVGEDPERYDWEFVKRQQQEDASMDAEGMSSAQRRRQTRRAARLSERRRREVKLRPEVAATADSPRLKPPTGWRSSPTVPDRPFSSQIGPTQQVFASQVERGRHGGRPPLDAQAARKKKRKAGF